MKTKTGTNYDDFDSIIYKYDSLPSTQTEAKRLALSGVKKAIIVTNEQTSGKGRRDRNWESPPEGGLYVSFLITPKIHPSNIHLINFAAGLAVTFHLRNVYGIDAALKWPNDVIVECENYDGHSFQKICGILSETTTNSYEVKFCITGIGINCKRASIPPELSQRACAIDDYYTGNIDKEELLKGISGEFFKRVQNFELSGKNELLREYISTCSTIGKAVRIETDGKATNGRATGIGKSGELLVETGDGIKSFSSADVFHATICKFPQ